MGGASWALLGLIDIAHAPPILVGRLHAWLCLPEHCEIHFTKSTILPMRIFLKLIKKTVAMKMCALISSPTSRCHWLLLMCWKKKTKKKKKKKMKKKKKKREKKINHNETIVAKIIEIGRAQLK